MSTVKLARQIGCWLIIAALAGFSSALSAAGKGPTDQLKQNHKAAKPVVYINKKFGFRFQLPDGWRGYSITISEWEGGDGRSYHRGEEIPPAETEKGPFIEIGDPRATKNKPRQNIPIMVFTKRQWELVEEGKLVVSAAPVSPGELGRNTKYVFALPPRYINDSIDGWDEVEKIIQSDPLQPF